MDAIGTIKIDSTKIMLTTPAIRFFHVIEMPPFFLKDNLCGIIIYSF